MDHSDAVLECVEGRCQLDLLPLQFEGAGIGSVDPGDDLHQRRLARAVLTHERMDVTALQPERHVVEREHAGEGLPDVRDLEQVFGSRNRTALPNDFRGRGTDRRHGVSSLYFPGGIPGGWRRCSHTIGGLEARWEVPRPQVPRLVRRRSRGLAVDQFLFMNWSMLAGVTSWKGM